jgi:hypothetical protein
MPKLPGVNHREAIRALEKAGFKIAAKADTSFFPAALGLSLCLETIQSTRLRWAESSRTPGFTVEEFRKFL